MLVVGDPDAGTVYVYGKVAGSWVSEGKLDLDDDKTNLTAVGGAAIGVSGGRVAVAETYVGVLAGFIGEPRLSIFERVGPLWGRTGTVVLPRDPAVPNDRVPAGFGMTGLGFSGRTVVVGAQYDPGFGAGVGDTIDYGLPALDYAGAAYVFAETGAGWHLSAHLRASNPGAADNFGSRVAIDGNTVVVPASGEDSNGKGFDGDQSNNDSQDSGAVYLFSLDCEQVPNGAPVSGC